MKIKELVVFSGTIAVLCFAFFSCGSMSTTKNPEKIDNLISGRHFEIENDWLLTLSGNRINLIGNPNSITFKGDSVNVFLPYFGVRSFGGGYNSENGIKYIGIAKNLEIFENENKESYSIRFKGNSGTEYMDFYITVYANGKTNTSVTTSQRQSISYMGNVKEIAKE